MHMRLSLAVLLIAPLAQAAPEGRIAYLAGSAPQSLRVHVLDLAGRESVALGPESGAGAPAWSPDGAWLAFSCARETGAGIFLAAEDGAANPLPHARAWNFAPRWSADSRRIAYSTGDSLAPAARAIAVADVRKKEESLWGGGAEGLLRPVWLPSTELMLALQPDKEVEAEGFDFEAFKKEAFGPGIILALALREHEGKQSTELVLVTPSFVMPFDLLLERDGRAYAEYAIEPDPPARQIAWETNEGGDREIYVLGLRGYANATNHRAHDWNPVWSPLGNWLAFESLRGGTRGIYAVYPRTARTITIAAPGAAQAWAPCFSPDEKHLVYVSDVTGDAELYICAQDGTEAERVTEHAGLDIAPAWRPVKPDK